MNSILFNVEIYLGKNRHFDIWHINTHTVAYTFVPILSITPIRTYSYSGCWFVYVHCKLYTRTALIVKWNEKFTNWITRYEYGDIDSVFILLFTIFTWHVCVYADLYECICVFFILWFRIRGIFKSSERSITWNHEKKTKFIKANNNNFMATAWKIEIICVTFRWNKHLSHMRFSLPLSPLSRSSLAHSDLTHLYDDNFFFSIQRKSYSSHHHQYGEIIPQYKFDLWKRFRRILIANQKFRFWISVVCSVVHLLLTRCHHQHQKRNLFGQPVAFTNDIDNKRIHTIPRNSFKMKSDGKCKAWTKIRILFVWRKRISLVELFETRWSFSTDFFGWIQFASTECGCRIVEMSRLKSFPCIEMCVFILWFEWISTKLWNAINFHVWINFRVFFSSSLGVHFCRINWKLHNCTVTTRILDNVWLSGITTNNF